jgi:hypothetical protein
MNVWMHQLLLPPLSSQLFCEAGAFCFCISQTQFIHTTWYMVLLRVYSKVPCSHLTKLIEIYRQIDVSCCVYSRELVNDDHEQVQDWNLLKLYFFFQRS